jgi:hypothetical protein
MPLRLTGKERTCRARASGRATPDLRRKPDKRFSSRLSRKLHRRAASGPLLHADMAPKWVPFERRLTAIAPLTVIDDQTMFDLGDSIDFENLIFTADPFFDAAA